MNRVVRASVALVTVLATLAAVIVLAATRGDQPESPAASADTSIRTVAVTAPPVTKVMVIVVENHSRDQMKAGMPKTFAFASKYAWASNYTAITHPSLPNYIAIAAGSTFGIRDDKGPAAHRLWKRNVFRQAIDHGKSAKVYADAMPSNCYLSNAGTYAVRHNPWPYFPGTRKACRRRDVPATRLAADAAAGTLPNVGFLIPDVIHDAHDGTLAQADEWISSKIAAMTAGPDWESGRLAIVVTADEDDHSAGNQVLTLVGSKYQQQKVVTTPLNHYSLTGFIEDVLHVGHLRQAQYAPSMREAFGVRVS